MQRIRVCSLTKRVLKRALTTAVATVVAIPATRAGAQLPQTSPADSAKAVAAAAIADTGRMVRPSLDLSHYKSPGMCFGLVKTVEFHVWRQNQRDTIPAGSPADTLPTLARERGLACAAQFNPSTIPPIQLFSLMQLGIWLNDVPLWQAALDRQLALGPTNAQRGKILSAAITQLRHAHPVQIDNVKLLLAKLDPLGRDATIPRFKAYQDVLGYYVMRFDTAGIISMLPKFNALDPDLNKTERGDLKEVAGYGSNELLKIAAYRLDPNLVELTRQAFEKSGLKGSRLEDIFVGLAERVGRPADSVPADYRFNTGDNPIRPRKGHVTLIVPVYQGKGTLYHQLTLLRDLQRKYGAQGLDVVLTITTKGYSWSSPPQSAEEEAKTDAWYFLEYFKLPFSLFVEKTTFTRSADGRLVPQPSRFRMLYPTEMALIGRDGKIRSLFGVRWPNMGIEKMVQAALAQQVSAQQAVTQ